MNIFLSPSNQTANRYAYGATNECVECERIAEYASSYLLGNYDCNVKIAERSDNMLTRGEKAKIFNADFYLAIHTNAFNSTVRGTETYYYSSDDKGKKFAAALLDKVSALTECKRRSKAYDTLIELNTPTCTRAYIEVDFHSNPDRAKWIIENEQKIGEAIAECIAEYFNLPKKESDTTVYIITAKSSELTAAEAEKAKSELEAAGYVVTLAEQVKDTADKPIQTPQETLFAVGDKVMLASDATVYGQNRGFSAWVYGVTLYVRQINGDRIVVSTKPTGAVTGAVDKKHLIQKEER